MIFWTQPSFDCLMVMVINTAESNTETLVCLDNSVQFSCSVMSDSLRPHELQRARPPCPSPPPGVHPNPCPLSRWRHPTTSSSVVPFSSCSQSHPHLAGSNCKLAASSERFVISVFKGLQEYLTLWKKTVYMRKEFQFGQSLINYKDQ